jgi:hypothetical protein
MQKYPSLLWRLYPSYVIVALLSFCLVAWYVTSFSSRLHNERVETELKSQAFLVEKLVGDRLSFDNLNEIDAMLKQLSQRTPNRITVALASGDVLGDSLMPRKNVETVTDLRGVDLMMVYGAAVIASAVLHVANREEVLPRFKADAMPRPVAATE